MPGTFPVGGQEEKTKHGKCNYFYQNHNNQPTQNRGEREIAGNSNVELPPRGRDEKVREYFYK